LHRRQLVCDSFRGHITLGIKAKVRGEYNTDMAVIPGGCTGDLQPADVSWNSPFKRRLGEQYDEWVFNGPVELTRGGNRKAAPIAILLKWIKEAWGVVTPDIIRKSFRKCGISNDLDGSEDHLFAEASDTENDFEGFTAEDIQQGQEFGDNVVNDPGIMNVELSDDSDIDSAHEDLDTDYESPGH